jgi:hypothetical protein
MAGLGSTPSPASPLLQPGNHRGPELDQDDYRDKGDDSDPAQPQGLTEEQVSAEGQGHRSMVGVSGGRPATERASAASSAPGKRPSCPLRP